MDTASKEGHTSPVVPGLPRIRGGVAKGRVDFLRSSRSPRVPYHDSKYIHTCTCTSEVRYTNNTKTLKGSL